VPTPLASAAHVPRQLVSLTVLTLLVVSSWGLAAGTPALARVGSSASQLLSDATSPSISAVASSPQVSTHALRESSPAGRGSLGRSLPGVTPLVADYVVSFLEEGLGGGITWTVTVTWSGGSATASNTSNRTNLTNESNISFLLPNDAYHFSVSGVSGYTASPSAGTFTVNNASLNRTIVFGQKVEFFESGLPTNVTWSVELAGQDLSNRTTASGGGILFVEPGGVYAYAVGNVPNGSFMVNTPSPPTGNVTVTGTNTFLTVGISYSSVPGYHITFSASKLPPFENWSVQSGPDFQENSTLLLGHSNRTSLGKISFFEPAGPFTYAITAPYGYGVAKLAGTNNPTLTSGQVSGNATWTVMFGSLQYLWFNQSALPKLESYPNASWKVTLTPAIPGGPPGMYNTSNNTTLNFSIPAGAHYRFTITGPSEYKISPSSGSITMPARNVTKVVTFRLLAEPVVFLEKGLERGLNWTVTITSGSSPVFTYPLELSKHGAGSIRFELPVGTYSYTISSTGTQTATPASGTITVTSAPSAAQDFRITFS
jgi:hypothetical protein